MAMLERFVLGIVGAMVLALASLVVSSPAEARPAATAWRIGMHDGATRIVLEISEPVAVRLEQREDTASLLVDLDGLDWAAGGTNLRGGIVSRAKVDAIDGATRLTRLTLALSRPARTSGSFLLQPSEGYGYRLVIDLDASPVAASPTPPTEPTKPVVRAVAVPTPAKAPVIAPPASEPRVAGAGQVATTASAGVSPLTMPPVPAAKPATTSKPTVSPIEPSTGDATATPIAKRAAPSADATPINVADAATPSAPIFTAPGSPFAPGVKPTIVEPREASRPVEAPTDQAAMETPRVPGQPLTVTVPIQSSRAAALTSQTPTVVGLVGPGALGEAMDPRPLIALDPGHGGTDPGATSVGGVFEKHLTLKFALALRDELVESGRYRVIMTREDDRFVPLRERVSKARSRGAALFLSLHADVLSDPGIAGLSVYTLSDTASDKEAEALAVKENKADLISGLDLSAQPAEVTRTLIDLAQRETNGLSVSLARALVRELGTETKLLPQAHRSAGFAVLTAPDIPSALLELGYLSNRDDEAGLRSADHQKHLARGIRRAIEAYFAGQGRLRRV